MTGTRLFMCCCALAVLALSANASQASYVQPVATYLFNNSLAAQQPGVPALVATDPLGQSSFETDSPFTLPQPTYQFVGASSPPDNQAGLTLDTTGLLTPNAYSVELVFKFFSGTNAWRRIVDIQDRQTDNGFYVNPSNALAVYPVVGSPDTFITDTYYHIVYTTDEGNIKAYLDGELQINTATNVLEINNPGNLLHLFLDNHAGPAQTEFSSGRIALARFYNSILSDSEVAALADNPFANPDLVPFPGDCNGDRFVDFADLGILINHYNQPGNFSQGDFDDTGIVDFADLGTLLNNYNQHAPTSSIGAPVPEPATMLLAACGSLVLLCIAGRRQTKF